MTERLNFECECGGVILNGKDSHCIRCLIKNMDSAIVREIRMNNAAKALLGEEE